jgi:hypothetical protein
MNRAGIGWPMQSHPQGRGRRQQPLLAVRLEISVGKLGIYFEKIKFPTKYQTAENPYGIRLFSL